MLHTRSYPRLLPAGMIAAVAAATLAGCSGSQAVNPAAAVGGSSSVHSIVNPDVKGHCSAHGGVRVTPCSVDFTASNYAPQTVTVRNPKSKKGTLGENDNCGGASGIATVTQGSGDGWSVMPGATAGSCTATFSFNNKKGKTVGWADLDITNSI